MSAVNVTGARKRTETGSILSKVIATLILLAAVGVLAMIARLAKRDTTAPPTEAPPVNVSVEIVSATPEIPDILTLPGQIEANRVVQIAAEVAGRVEQVHCEEGKNCRKGDFLLTLNADRLSAEFRRALAQYEGDKRDYKRMKSLVSEGAGTQKQLDDAESRMSVSKAVMEAAQVDLERAKIQSPISGVLNDALVEEGEYVHIGTPVVEVVDIDTMKAIVHVPESDILFFKTGETATITADVKGVEKELAGTITYISALADQRTRSTRMEIALDNRDRFLRSGQIVDVRLKRRVLKDVIMVPLLTVIPLEEGKAVYVVEDGKAARRDVTIGFIKGSKVRITSGLKPGDRLIVAGHRYVGPGQPVIVREQE